jgi:hypothetical protein
MTKKTTTVLAGVAVAALAATAVGAAVRYRQGDDPHPDEHAHLDELAARLHDAEPGANRESPSSVSRTIQSLQRNQGISVARLRQWITGLRHQALSREQATVAESDFGALEWEADQRGA